MTVKIQSCVRRILFVLVLATVPGVSGCLWVAAGLGAAGAATYVYTKGNVCEEYRADYNETWQATKAALAELKLPIGEEKPGASSGTIEARTGDQTTVYIDIESIPPRIPAEGPTTSVCVRVGLIGDDEVSHRILDAVGVKLLRELAPGSDRIAPQPTSPLGPPVRPGRGGRETSEPPPAAPGS